MSSSFRIINSKETKISCVRNVQEKEKKTIYGQLLFVGNKVVQHKNIYVSITQLSIPTHAHLQRHRLKLIRNHLKKLLHVSVFDHLRGVTMSSLKSLLLLTTVGCFYAKSGDVAACRVVCIGLYLKSA